MRFAGRNIADYVGMNVADAAGTLARVQLNGSREAIARPILTELGARLGFMVDVGLDYLTLDRRAATLSAGEAQRIRLATQIGSALVGVMYILDEPSIGLHQRDNARLLRTLIGLRDAGNSLNRCRARRGDDPRRGLDRGHGTGRRRARGRGGIRGHTGGTGGGRFPHRQISQSQPGHRDPGRAAIRQRVRAGGRRRPGEQPEIGGRANPAGDAWWGSPGSPARARAPWSRASCTGRPPRRLHGARAQPGEHERLLGLEHIDKVVAIDQAPIGRTPRSNPATYTGVFGPIRELFAAVPGGPGAGLQARPLLIQCEGRALRGVPGRRRLPHRNAVPAGRLRDLRNLRRASVQPGGAANPLSAGTTSPMYWR